MCAAHGSYKTKPIIWPYVEELLVPLDHVFFVFVEVFQAKWVKGIKLCIFIFGEFVSVEYTRCPRGCLDSRVNVLRSHSRNHQNIFSTQKKENGQNWIFGPEERFFSKAELFGQRR